MAPNSTSDTPTNPNEHLNIPKWVNEDYFLPILQKDVADFVSIKRFTPVAATAPGENYTSVMVRVIMEIELRDGSSKQLNYILKTVLETEEGAALVNSMNLFPKEEQMYTVIIPQFTRLYEDANAGIRLGPRCVHVEKTPERITLVLEDLKVQNFVNADRLKGLDFAHMRRVLRKLAELHAASAKYFELNGPYDDIYLLSFFTEANRELYEAMSAARKPIFEKAMDNWGLENADHFKKISPTVKQFFDEAIRMNSVNPEEFNVLNHGDCWANNIMFNYKSNSEIDEVIFVDFQLGKWGTPAQDLWYFIVSSSALDIKVKEFDHFIQIYHERLVECLKLLNYSKALPTLKDIHIMMLKYGAFGLLTAHGVLCAILLPSDKDANIDNFIKTGPEGDELRYKTFTNPYYTKAVCQLYPFFEQRGVFEFPTES